jgi:RHS repeat-associated protein
MAFPGRLTRSPRTGYHIIATYQGLKKIVTNQRQKSSANAYDVYQRLKKVEQNYNVSTGQSYSVTEYTYDTLGNLIQVIAGKGATEQNTTTMPYDSLSKKKTMNDPDMGYWTYLYDKSGNLELQTDAKGQKIRFRYDGLNRVYEKAYGDPVPISTVYYTYDDPAVPYSKGKLTKVSYQPPGEELREDAVLEYDEMQRVKRSQKTIPGSSPVILEKAYDSAGRAVSIAYPGSRIYGYEYDVAGNLLYLKDNATQNNVVAYSTFTVLGQPTLTSFSNSVSTTYGYYPETGRLYALLTQKPGNPTYQNLTYQYDPKGNIATLNDQVNGINHTYGYDSLDRLDWAKGNNGSIYDHNYNYDRIGNITYKSDVGTYSYTYSNRPHAVQSAGPFTFTYDANGNMTSKTGGGVNITINPQDWNYDNKPTRIQNGSNIIDFVYDGNGQRVKKTSPSQTVFYFGELYELRNGVEILHLFAGSRRIASIRLTDGKNQFYHPNHLGSASVITDQNGQRKEQIEYHPFGTYRDVGSPTGTYDYDAQFPDVNYTFTDQEDDDDLGLYNYGARLYDPVLGKFISPDSIVPYPDDPQTLNRYSYVNNNPLRYVDPEGQFLIEIIVGAVLGAATSAIQGGDVDDILKGALIGAISGAVGGMVGAEVAGVAYDLGAGEVGAAVAGGAAGGAAAGGTNAALTGGNIAQSMLIGAVSGGISGGLGIAVKGSNPIVKGVVQIGSGALIGGGAAELTGGDFYQGAMMGALSGAVGFSTSELVGGYLEQMDQRILGQAKEMLFPASKDAEQASKNMKLFAPKVPAEPIGPKQYEYAQTFYYQTKSSFNFDINLQRSLDVSGGFKFGNMHIQNFKEGAYVHFDRYDFVRAPIRHLIYEGWRGVATW